MKEVGHIWAAMREGRRRPSLVYPLVVNLFQHLAAMREGRRRPSLGITRNIRNAATTAAMREGRRRPSLRHSGKVCRDC